MLRLPRGAAGTCATLLSLFVLCSRQDCASQCRQDEECCRGGSPVSCCKVRPGFLDHLTWITRKLSGVLILLLLFAMGYFIQRLVCPRPRRQRDGAEEPPLLARGGHAARSQDSLLERVPDLGSPPLPAYDVVKYLPTYEESMRELDRDRSDENLVAASPGAAGLGEDRRGTGGSTRATRKSV
ncbi:uncharacterized membrane protein C3orf80 homolog [Denticeps clupeoides]|uniref:uncharacterized membrane protein C3orf80 homolog n=1 Tax=Denticeps clupeoides TaxID=299321 RepID=UPI0010A314A7|nr:uncharacterized membrane protein C3orf80 homolog [Denticeps clupeoides]